MKFDFVERFSAAPEDVLAVLVDDDFWTGIDDLSATSVPEVLGVSASGNRVTVELRYRLDVDLPSEAARFIDTSNVSWVEITEWDRVSLRSDTRFVPDQAGRLMSASATSLLVPSGSGANRNVNGDLRVKIPLLGSRVERAIIGGVEDHLGEVTDAVERYLS